jgi:hypothetical protein
MPAAGFALTLERLHMALAEQGASPAVAGIDTVVGGPDAAERLAAARTLRGEGETALLCDGDREEAVRTASRVGASRVVWADGDAVETVPLQGGRT